MFSGKYLWFLDVYAIHSLLMADSTNRHIQVVPLGVIDHTIG